MFFTLQNISKAFVLENIIGEQLMRFLRKVRTLRIDFLSTERFWKICPSHCCLKFVWFSVGRRDQIFCESKDWSECR